MSIWKNGKSSMKHHNHKKKIFCNQLNIEDITDADYLHAKKKVCKYFQIINLADYHDFYLERDTLLLANLFENFRNMCLEISDLEPAHYLSPCTILASSFQKN